MGSIRIDWIPATLRYLDEVYEAHRGEVPAQRKPSEYWQSNCLGGASFIHKAEVAWRTTTGIGLKILGPLDDAAARDALLRKFRRS